MTSWASASEHVTSGFAMEKSTTICEKNLCKNARIPALGYGAVEDEEECRNIIHIYIYLYIYTVLS